jgi:hypothetical protein
LENKPVQFVDVWIENKLPADAVLVASQGGGKPIGLYWMDNGNRGLSLWAADSSVSGIRFR